MQLARWWRHAMTTPASLRRAFPEATLAKIRDTVAASESIHSGEIRFAVEAGLPWSYLKRDAPARERATMVFSKLKVWDTEQNNGVLIYVALADHGIEIVVDRGVSARIDPSQWQGIIDRMRTDFAVRRFESGAIAAVTAVGDLLAQHFPATGSNNVDELPNAPVVL